MSKFDYSYIVCQCNKVSLGEIIYTIEDKNAKTIDDIKKITDAGTTCGYCIRKEDDFNIPKLKLHIIDILKRYTNE